MHDALTARPCVFNALSEGRFQSPPAFIAAWLGRWPLPIRHDKLFGIHCLVSKEPSVCPLTTLLEGCSRPDPRANIVSNWRRIYVPAATLQV